MENATIILYLLKILIAGVGIGIGIYYSKYMKPFFYWLKGGIENGDDHLENKELQLAFFTALAGYMIISISIWGTEYPEVAFYGVFGGAGVLYAVNRLAQGWEKVRKNGNDDHSEKNKPKQEDKDL